MKVASHSFNIGDIVEVDNKTLLITHKLAEVSYYGTCILTGSKIIISHKLDKIKKVS
jgi:hypothetical protein